MWGRGCEDRLEILELALLHGYADALDDGVLVVFMGFVFPFEVHAEEAAEALPEGGAERAEEGFDYVVAALVGFALNQLDKHAGLPFGEAHQHGFVLLEDGALHLFQIFFAFGLSGEGLDVFVCLEQCLADEFGVGEGAFHITHGAPVEFALFLVLEFEFGKYCDVVEHEHQHRVALFGDFMVFSAEHILHSGAGALYGAFFLEPDGIVRRLFAPLDGLLFGLLESELHRFVGMRALGRRKACGKRNGQL